MLINTRLWYGFYGAAVESGGAAFEAKISELCRELGPPSVQAGEAAAAAHEPAEVAAPAPAPSLRLPSTTPNLTATGSGGGGGGGGGGASFAEMAAFVEQTEARCEAKLEKLQRQHSEALRQQHAKLSAAVEKTQAQAQAQVLSGAELSALQTRLERLHQATLLTDEELHAVEDLLADCFELQASAPGGSITAAASFYLGVGSGGSSGGMIAAVLRLVAVSEGLSSDAAFARQLRRKFS